LGFGDYGPKSLFIIIEMRTDTLSGYSLKLRITCRKAEDLPEGLVAGVMDILLVVLEM